MVALGLDIGGSSIKGGFVERNGLIHDRLVFPIDPSKNQEAIVEELISVVNLTIKRSLLPLEQIQGIGVGCPGSINSATGHCDYSNNLKWENLPLGPLLAQGTGLRVKVANDANAAALGEVTFGVGKGYENLVFLTIGTGIGSGLFLNGRLYEGNEGKGAELGHTLLVMNGKHCTCGRKGCLEAYCSIGALKGMIKDAIEKNPSSLLRQADSFDAASYDPRWLFLAAKKGDKAAKKVLNEYVANLGEGLLNIINAFRPEIIVIGGGVSAQKEALTAPLIAYLEKNHYGFGGLHAPKVKIVTSEFGNDAGILGAASLVF
jgi:Transcriptional regulator/sugar kinase